eukprot:TRINITY_DN7877_c0_g3_i1.p1 TRINITY_DN7877_c0_g3~~TRINITY_DN7877_c0_g3_i1.p1  ORF type:complete len:100 (+),score=8.26 TRINITY_DN7877_c0_g3_i1:103-402(+)
MLHTRVVAEPSHAQRVCRIKLQMLIAAPVVLRLQPLPWVSFAVVNTSICCHTWSALLTVKQGVATHLNCHLQFSRAALKCLRQAPTVLRELYRTAAPSP